MDFHFSHFAVNCAWVRFVNVLLEGWLEKRRSFKFPCHKVWIFLSSHKFLSVLITSFSCRNSFICFKALRKKEKKTWRWNSPLLASWPHMNNSWLCAYGPWLLEDDERCFRSLFPSTYFPHALEGQAFGGMITHCAWITVHIPLWFYWKTQWMVPSAGNGSPTLRPHTYPLVFFSDFPSTCLPLWFLMGPLGSSRCIWGAIEGLCQEFEWSLYRLAFNVPPVLS